MGEAPHASRAALVVAHPSHELLVHGWLEQARPWTFVLTDGGGPAGRSRLPATTRVLARAGAAPGSIYGRLSDRALYDAMLSGDTDVFTRLAAELAEALAALDVAVVVGDRAEGYSPAHDVCRMIINAAVVRASRRLARPIGNLDFSQTAPPDPSAPEERAAVRIDLDDAQAGRKLDAAAALDEAFAEDLAAARAGGRFRGIARLSEPPPAAHSLAGNPAFAGWLEAIAAGAPLDAFRSECLRPVDATMPVAFATKPLFELYGEQRVASGRYHTVIRFAPHLRPIQDALTAFAAS